MSVSGLCDVCQDAEAVARCERCGAVVCREHDAPEVGYCVECARLLGDGDSERSGGRGGEGDTFTF